jgi:hypothetical protein
MSINYGRAATNFNAGRDGIPVRADASPERNNGGVILGRVVRGFWTAT